MPTRARRARAIPPNTALALGELLRDGVHGIVNFPVQDTVYPHGWEAPWANWSYAWDAALTSTSTRRRVLRSDRLHSANRSLVTARCSRGRTAADAGIIWPP